jgi:hypothetical protein
MHHFSLKKTKKIFLRLCILCVCKILNIYVNIRDVCIDLCVKNLEFLCACAPSPQTHTHAPPFGSPPHTPCTIPTHILCITRAIRLDAISHTRLYTNALIAMAFGASGVANASLMLWRLSLCICSYICIPFQLHNYGVNQCINILLTL